MAEKNVGYAVTMDYEDEMIYTIYNGFFREKGGEKQGRRKNIKYIAFS